jgi:hypothetical protein
MGLEKQFAAIAAEDWITEAELNRESRNSPEIFVEKIQGRLKDVEAGSRKAALAWFKKLRKKVDALISDSQFVGYSPEGIGQIESLLAEMLQASYAATRVPPVPELPLFPLAPVPPPKPELPVMTFSYQPTKHYLDSQRLFREELLKIKRSIPSSYPSELCNDLEKLCTESFDWKLELDRVNESLETPNGLAEYNCRLRKWLGQIWSQREEYWNKRLAIWPLHAQGMVNWSEKPNTEVHRLHWRIVQRLRDEVAQLTVKVAPELSIRKVPWVLLPPGERISEQANSILDALHRRYPNEQFDESRIEYACSLKPNAAYVGLDEFSGYLAFTFEHTDRVLLDHPKVGNAAYVFAGDWRELSQQSKSQLLRENRGYVFKIVHGTRGAWRCEIGAALR